MNFLTIKGAKELLLKSRSPHAYKLSNLLNIKMDTKYECKEGGTIKQVLQVFSGEIMKTQQSCGPYRIDLYFPEYRLAVECDENNHDDRDPDYERKRARFIKRNKTNRRSS